MNRLTRAYVQFYWNSNRDVLLSKDTEHHTDIIEGLRKKDAATVIEFIRLDLHCRYRLLSAFSADIKNGVQSISGLRQSKNPLLLKEAVSE